MNGSEYCVICGREVPEGRMVCPICERSAEDISPQHLHYIYTYDLKTVINGLLFCADGQCQHCKYSGDYHACNTLSRDAAHYLLDMIEGSFRHA